MNLYERSQLYKKNEPEEHINDVTKEDLEECTFKPKINQPKIPKRQSKF